LENFFSQIDEIVPSWMLTLFHFFDSSIVSFETQELWEECDGFA
jgi:hypothetical protein